MYLEGTREGTMIRVVCILLCAFAAGAVAQVAVPNNTGYPTVAAALEALKAKAGTRISVSKSWTTIEDMDGEDVVLWSFTVATHAAHPSLVKRTLRKKEDGYYIDMNVLCEANDAAACAGLVRSFQALNEQVKRSLAEGK
jgi:hypothetical protein